MNALEIMINLNKAHWFTEDLVSKSIHLATAAPRRPPAPRFAESDS